MERPLPSQTFTSKRHDTAISLPLTFTPPPGLNWNLQSAGTTVKFIARLPQQGVTTPKIDKAAVVTGEWSVRFDPAAADVNEIGAYDVEVEVIRSDGRKVTLPTVGFLKWTIGPDLNNA
jgi:hypothetical protein